MMFTASDLEHLEKALGITFSEAFCTFWKAYIVSDRMPDFRVERGMLGGSFARRLYDSDMAIIQVEKTLTLPVHVETALAHEIVHLALDREGYPVIVRGKKPPLPDGAWEQVASGLHSVLTHSIVWHRMREWNLSVDEHIRLKATGRLESVRAQMHRCPRRKEAIQWLNWLFQYMVARLDWPEPEREQIHRVFLEDCPSVGKPGERYVKRLYSLGYSAPGNLTPSLVFRAGEMLIRLLEIDDTCQPGTVMTVPKD